MDLQGISLDPIRATTVAVLGYGNQGRAHALNLRDSGVEVVVGTRPGKGKAQATRDGFHPLGFDEATDRSHVIAFLLPDQIIPEVYRGLANRIKAEKKTVALAHGFVLKYGLIERFEGCGYFLAGPKGAGAILRQEYEKGKGLPGIFAVLPKEDVKTRALCLGYAKALGLAHSFLQETSFEEETECDLFGEQAVLCGGILQLMESAFEILTKNGHSPEMAFFECCFEARMILELWMKYGPTELSERISPTAFYGGLTRGKRLVTDETRKEMEKIFKEIRGGEFAREWLQEVDKGMPSLKQERARLKTTPLQKIYDGLRASALKGE